MLHCATGSPRCIRLRLDLLHSDVFQWIRTDAPVFLNVRENLFPRKRGLQLVLLIRQLNACLGVLDVRCSELLASMSSCQCSISSPMADAFA